MHELLLNLVERQGCLHVSLWNLEQTQVFGRYEITHEKVGECVLLAFAPQWLIDAESSIKSRLQELVADRSILTMVHTQRLTINLENASENANARSVISMQAYLA